MVQQAKRRILAVALAGLTVVSCSSEPKPEASASAKASPPAATTKPSAEVGGSSVSVKPGEAGGVVESVLRASATVSAIDPASRKITLTTAQGRQATFTASDEIRNFDRLRVGDRVNATLNERIVVLVGPAREPGVAHAAMVARAPEGAKPGAIAAEVFEVVSAVKAIDPATRTATLQFEGGDTIDVLVRPDVDLSRYKVGDSVTIRVTQQLSLLAESP